MPSKELQDRGHEPGLSEDLYGQMLDRTREVGDKAIDRLRGLGDRLPGGLVEQVERLHDDPTHERRKAARVADPPLAVAVHMEERSGRTEGTAMKDHSPMGLAVLLPCPAGVGTLLRIRLPTSGAWVTVEVKHCRKEGAGWVAGCELLENQPLI